MVYILIFDIDERIKMCPLLTLAGCKHTYLTERSYLIFLLRSSTTEDPHTLMLALFSQGALSGKYGLT